MKSAWFFYQKWVEYSCKASRHYGIHIMKMYTLLNFAFGILLEEIPNNLVVQRCDFIYLILT